MVSDRCAHRGASLSMGEVQGEGDPVPLPRLGVGRRRRALHADPLTRRPGPDPAAGPDPAPSRCGSSGGWSGRRWRSRWASRRQLPWFEPEQWRWGHGTPFELPVGFGVMIENFRDVAHFAFVHQATLGAIPEVVEPLEVERDGLEVTMSRETMESEPGVRRSGARCVRSTTTRSRPTSRRPGMFTTKGERCLLHCCASDQRHRVGALLDRGTLSEDFDELHASRRRSSPRSALYAEDRAIISAVEPRELPLDPDADVSTLADRFTLAYRQAFAEFVRRALAGRVGSVQLERELSVVAAADQAGELERALLLAPLRSAELDQAPHQRRIARRGADLGTPPQPPKNVSSTDTVVRVSSRLPGLGGWRPGLQRLGGRKQPGNERQLRSRSRRGRPVARRHAMTAVTCAIGGRGCRSSSRKCATAGSGVLFALTVNIGEFAVVAWPEKRSTRPSTSTSRLGGVTKAPEPLIRTIAAVADEEVERPPDHGRVRHRTLPPISRSVGKRAPGCQAPVSTISFSTAPSWK